MEQLAQQEPVNAAVEAELPAGGTPAAGDGQLPATGGTPGPTPPANARQPMRRRTQRGMVTTLLFCFGIILCGLLYTLGLTLLKRVPPAVQSRPVLTVRPADTSESLSTTEIVAAVAPSVVSIDIYEPGALSAGGSGSGVILSGDGYIATNAHVVHGADRIRVVLHDGRGYTAKVVGAAPKSDLAVIKIETTGLTPAAFGDSDAVQVGERVLAIGNATGTLPGSVASGIVSGLSRSVPLAAATGEVVRLQLIQTDAAINPGNSGGALVDGFGQVIGINVGKVEKENVENVGFAIPTSYALPVLQQIINEQNSPSMPKLGVSVVALNETNGPPMGLPATGLYIAEITPESGLKAFGVRVGDVILAADGRPLIDTVELHALVMQHAPGDELTLRIYLSHSGEEVDITVVLYEEPAEGGAGE